VVTPIVAALYVDANGVYADAPDVDLWPESRDARLYDGPWPVVAHPPCARWCAIAKLVELRYGYKIGDDGGCFAAALLAVRRFGGVLEHPASSIAWRHFDLPRPARGIWLRTLFDHGYVTEIDQHAYGHPARKRTWLYYVGANPADLNWTPAPEGLPVVSSFSYNRGAKWHTERMRVRPDKASATPAGFRDALLLLARSSAGTSSAAAIRGVTTEGQ